jgi:hypothetical protein
MVERGYSEMLARHNMMISLPKDVPSPCCSFDVDPAKWTPIYPISKTPLVNGIL